MSLVVSRLTVWRAAIPMRQRFKHAAAQRDVSRPVIVKIELRNGASGVGETHLREYVTGETIETMPATLENTLIPAVLEVRGRTFAEALDCIAALPHTDADGRVMTGLRAAIELALLDAYSRAYGHSLEYLAGWLGDPHQEPPGSLRTIRYSGVISAEDPSAVRRSILKMRLYGLRDFKIKVGDDGDDARLRAAADALRKPLASGRATLRVDANGAWNVSAAQQRLESWRDIPLAAIEQPLPRSDDDRLVELAGSTDAPIMADESLVTSDDAARLIDTKAVRAFNIRLAKNGGLIPSLQMAMTAMRAGLMVQLGCLVGETSILTAAGRWFLYLLRGVRFAEGAYGRHLLRGDVTTRELRFGFGGRLRPPRGVGLGIELDAAQLNTICAERPLSYVL